MDRPPEEQLRILEEVREACEGDAREMQGRFKGDAKEIQGRFKGDAREIKIEVEGCEGGVRRAQIAYDCP